MAPEVLRVRRRTMRDLWALGVVLYEGNFRPVAISRRTGFEVSSAIRMSFRKLCRRNAASFGGPRSNFADEGTIAKVPARWGEVLAALEAVQSAR